MGEHTPREVADAWYRAWAEEPGQCPLDEAVAAWVDAGCPDAASP